MPPARGLSRFAPAQWLLAGDFSRRFLFDSKFFQSRTAAGSFARPTLGSKRSIHFSDQIIVSGDKADIDLGPSDVMQAPKRSLKHATRPHRRRMAADLPDPSLQAARRPACG
jgi:hypothetical protein